MIQSAAMHSAKPSSTGLELLGGMPGEAQNSAGFEAFLETQMEGAAAPVGVAGMGVRQTSGKESGKQGGKILPLELPVGEAASLAVLAPVAAIDVAGAKDETVSEKLAQPEPGLQPVVIPSVLAVVDPVATATVETDPSAGGQAPLAMPRMPAAMPQPGAADSSRPVASGLPQQGAAGPHPEALFGVTFRSELSSAPFPLPAAVELPPLPGQAADAPAPPARIVSTAILAAAPFPASADAIRLRPVAAGAGKDGSPAPTAEPVPGGMPLPAMAGLTRASAVSKAAAGTHPNLDAEPATALHVSDVSATDTPRPVPAIGESRQDSPDWFGPASLPQPAAAAPGSVVAASRAVEQPHDFATLVDRLIEARDSALPATVHAAINHAEFGSVSLKFEHDDAGLTVGLSSPDPEFARAVQAAAPADRQGVAQEGGSSAGFSALRQDTLSQSGGGAQPQSRNAGSNERQAGDARLRQGDRTSGQSESDKPRRDGIFA